MRGGLHPRGEPASVSNLKGLEFDNKGNIRIHSLKENRIAEPRFYTSEVKDILGKTTKIALLGIAPSQKIENVRYGFFQSFGMGFRKLIDLTVITYKALWSIVTGSVSIKESMTGPIGIFIITGKAAQMGLIYLVHLMGLLSASLAIFNLLPLPVLDGGHIMFLFVEKLRGKPLSLKTQENF